MRIFWDANIVVDLVDQARPGHGDALTILKSANQRADTNLCAWHTLSILSYLCSRKFGRESADEIIQELLNVFEIPATGNREARRAFTYNFCDYEDALQISSAVAGYADCIVTLDTKGFRQSPITVLLPKDAISLLRKR